jgi:hypothetical protein
MRNEEKPVSKKSEDVDAKAVDSPLVTIEFNGRDFSFPRDRRNWPTGALYAISKDESMEFLRWLFGDEQFEALLHTPQGLLVDEFMPAFNKAVESECVN